MIYNKSEGHLQVCKINVCLCCIQKKQKLMGGSESSGNHSTDVEISNPKFKSAQMVTHDNKRVLETHIGGIQKAEYQRWAEQFKQSKINNQQFLLLPLKHSYASEGMCSSNGVATLSYPEYPRLLTDQIDERRQKKTGFEEDQLWYLLYASANAKINMKPEEKIGDVRPQNVFINDQGTIKFSNVLSWPGQVSNYKKAFENEQSYLAPEEVKQLGTARLAENGEAEMFSIGLTLLSAANLQDFTDLYDIKLHTFNDEKFQRNLDEFKVNDKYSEILRSTVSNLLEKDPAKRMHSDELWKLVEPYQEKIKGRESFVIHNAPQKLHEQVGQLRKALPLLMQVIKGPKKEPTYASGYNSSFPIRDSTSNRITIQNTTQAQSLYIPRPN